MGNKIALINCSLLDGSENMKLQENMTVVIQDEKIAEIGENISVSGCKVIDLKGKYLLPGLINAHVHLPGSGKPKKGESQNADSVKRLMKNPITRYIVKKMCQGYAKTELMSGTTTIRTVGGLDNIDSSIRDDINNGKYLGPRMLVSDMAVSVTGGHMAEVLAYVADSPLECRECVKKIAKGKPDLIKLMITGGVLDAKVKGEPGILKMPLDYVTAACDEAHKLGLKVAAHTESPEGVLVALKGGVDTIEHGAKPNDEMIALYKEKGASNICTISPALPLSTFPSEITHSNDLTRYNGKVVMDGIIEAAKECLKNDIPVGLGTDTACPFVTHYNTWRELFLFHKYVGVSTAFALHTITLGNARILEIDDVTGSVEVGKSADLFIASGNPLEDLYHLSKPYMVVIKGNIIKNPKIKKFNEIDSELDKAFSKLV
jgi:imidazolonepropionase-like amidohydrolase